MEIRCRISSNSALNMATTSACHCAQVCMIDGSSVGGDVALALRDGLDLAKYAQKITTPDFCNLLLGVAPADQLSRDIRGLALVAEADHAGTVIEVGSDPDVID